MCATTCDGLSQTFVFPFAVICSTNVKYARVSVPSNYISTLLQHVVILQISPSFSNQLIFFLLHASSLTKTIFVPSCPSEWIVRQILLLHAIFYCLAALIYTFFCWLVPVLRILHILVVSFLFIILYLRTHILFLNCWEVKELLVIQTVLPHVAEEQ